MKLASFQIRRFRNILDSGVVPADTTITCLVGKNESGKTNLLHALHTLNPALDDRLLDEHQYPRWLQKEHQRSGEYAQVEAISATFLLESEDIKRLTEAFGDGVVTSREWTCSRNYANTRFVRVDVDEWAACRAIEARHRVTTGATKMPALAAELDKLADETQPDASGAPVPTPDATRAAAAKADLDARYPDADPAQAVRNFLIQAMPRFFYFDDYSQIEGRTDIAPLLEALRSSKEGTLTAAQRTALALLRLGFANEQLVSADYEKRSGEMEAVAADLTRQVRRYWHQNDRLRLEIDIEPVEQQLQNGQHIIERYLQLRVMDERHFFTNNLDVRSSGFRWFVSFLAAFKDFAPQRELIVLLDEPALALHARAQADFLAFIEDTLAARHQVIYTTHSPFMVDAVHLERVRVVEDHGPDEGGVTVKTQLMSRDPDTLSPLQAALGYDIAQNIFVGPDNLVVEGLADYTYVVVLSEVLRAAGRTSLDARWRVLPAGGAGTMPAAISLLGRELDVTVVVDGTSRPPQKLTALVDEGILDRTRIITLGAVTGMKVADIEDLFDPEDYLALYNAALGQQLSVGDLDSNPDRILARIERKAGSFNHNDPSNWLLEHRGTQVPTLRPLTLDRFEKLFEAINATLR